MWRSWLSKGTTCLLQVAAPRFLHPRHLTRLCRRPRLWPPCGWQPRIYSPEHGGTRGLKKDAKSTVDFPENPITVTDIKQYLRSKDVVFHDGYSCLHIPSIFVSVSARKDAAALFVDKTTGQFLCKDTLVEGSWEDLQDCLEVMQMEGREFLSPHFLLGYQESAEEVEERERELREVLRIWSSSVPLADLPEDEAQRVKLMFQVRSGLDLRENQ